MEAEAPKADVQDWRDYCRLQYERIAQHENQRLTFTSVVLVTSSGVLIFGARFSEPSTLNVIVLALLIIVINLAAMRFIDESRYWVKYHQDHARHARKRFAPDLPSDEPMSADETPSFELKPKGKKDSERNPLRRAELQKALHGALIVLAVVYAIGTWVTLA